MQEELGLQARLVRGSGGVFEITLDGDLIFSKKELGRFPAESEVEKILEERL